MVNVNGTLKTRNIDRTLNIHFNRAVNCQLYRTLKRTFNHW